MANKSKLTDEELLKQFEQLESIPDAAAAPSAKGPSASKTTITQFEDELEELRNLAERPGSRPHTPRLGGSGTGTTRSPRSAGTNTPPPTGRSSEEREKAQLTRKSGESTRSFHTGITPTSQATVEEEDKPESKLSPAAQPQTNATSGGGWWGGIFATATAAVKTAEAAVKEIQQNEEAKRWAEQVKGNVGALRDAKKYERKGGELRQRALPTFTNILHTLAPPISSHERLQIHITHDLVDYPSLDPLIYQTFSRVMAQVDGGDLMVIQRGHESSRRRDSDGGYTGARSGGWNDGPWWRQPGARRNLSAVKGVVEGTKLAKVSAESYAHEFFASRGGVEEAARKAADVLSESNPVRSSDIFLAIQAISHMASGDHFGGPSSEAQDATSVVDPDEKPDNLISFAIYLHDPIHGITFYTITQPLPQQWADWLDAPSPAPKSPEIPTSPSSGGFFSRGSLDGEQYTHEPNLPEEIAEIINSGGVDPREWIAEWVEEVLTLGVGIVAQRYVARRMGVGEGGIGRGKARQAALESGGGEAARAI
ncbi:hypothetical protein FGG08_007276 [Glutinoglossum americanum]|uniref:Maintenance of telomere capping protein 1 n=1 Tax=Glutinoglossum americanum TaxID=1670608 RepID=A0A9P8KZJ4_9PEZI|nr:hypothetical protein FGG08_007276 [Glutinoglossum americanum]